VGPLKRWMANRGGLPSKLRAELESEGLLLLEERLEGEVIYRGYEAMGQRPASGHQSTIASLALTPRRLVVHGTQGVQLAARPGPVTSAVDEPGVLTLSYEAGDIYPTRSGSVTLRLQTPRANDIHARLTAWTQTSPS
jgi:hypothetical protein